MKAPNAIPISTAEKIGDNDALDAVAACPPIVKKFKYISISSFIAQLLYHKVALIVNVYNPRLRPNVILSAFL